MHHYDTCQYQAGFIETPRKVAYILPFEDPEYLCLPSHGGMGMMADDVMSAVYANLALRILLWIAPSGLL